MYTTINKNDFINAFRAIRPDNFSYEGLCELYDYFMQYEADAGEQLELDVIAICCDFSENTPEDIAERYGIEFEPQNFDGDWLQFMTEFLIDQGCLVGTTSKGTIVYEQF